MDRHSSRILAMQGACQLEAVGAGFLGDLDGFLADEGATGATAGRAKSLVEQLHEHQDAIDERITTAATNWDVKRLAPVDRAVLRVSVCELWFHRDTPVNVVINEAVEMGKLFGSAESAGFINGVLDAVSKQLEADRGTAGESTVVESGDSAAKSEAGHGAV